MDYWLTESYAVHLFAVECGHKELLGLQKFETEYFRKVFGLWKSAHALNSLSVNLESSQERGYTFRHFAWLQEGVTLLVYDLFIANQAIWEVRMAKLLVSEPEIAKGWRFKTSEISTIIPELITDAQELLEIALAERQKLRSTYNRWLRGRASEVLPLVKLILREPDEVICCQFNNALATSQELTTESWSRVGADPQKRP